jgi:hypothetical protein
MMMMVKTVILNEGVVERVKVTESTCNKMRVVQVDKSSWKQDKGEKNSKGDGSREDERGLNVKIQPIRPLYIHVGSPRLGGVHPSRVHEIEH